MTNTPRFKFAFAILVSLLPLNLLRVAAYRLIFRYRIENARIGWGTILAVEHADLRGCTIGMFNRFTGPILVRIGRGTLMGDANVFYGNIPTRTARPVPTERVIEIGADLHIGSHHFFDLSGSISIGDRTQLGGRHSQFWTHGGSQGIQNIRIGKHCYLASAVLFAAGTELGDNVIVGLGSVVTRSFNQNNLLIAGNPARLLKENYDWQTQQSIGLDRTETDATV